jgi:regulator of sigma D
MLDNCDIKERWSGVNELIARWLGERQSLIVQYCAISGIHEFSPQGANRNRLQKFCQLLLDYVSAGHFEVYYQLLREAEAFQDGSAEAAKALLPEINGTTAEALDFNDKYADAQPVGLQNLARDLSRLGEVLAARFDHEDHLISVLHAAHREQVA